MVERWMKRTQAMKIVVVSILAVMLWSITTQAIGVQVQDDAGAFSSEEYSNVEAKVEELENETSWDVIVLTTADAQGNSANGYGELFYNEHKGSEDGVVLLLDFDNGRKEIVTSGEAILYLTDQRIEAVLEASDQYSGTEQYADMILVMCDVIEDCYEAGADGNYIVEENTLSFFDIIIAFLAAIVLAGAFVGFIVGKYRLKFGGYKYSFRANGTVNLNVDEDHFVNQFVTRRHIPRNDDNNGGGSSSVHAGAGGGTFGGGGSDL